MQSLFQRVKKFNIDEMAIFLAHVSIAAQQSPKIENVEQATQEALKALRLQPKEGLWKKC